MASGEREKFDNAVVDWIDERLPIFTMMQKEYGVFPTPKNFNYFWNFGAIAMVMLMTLLVTGIWLAMAYWKGPNEKPVNVPTDTNAICFLRFDRDNRLLQRESINTPLTDSIVQLRIDSKGVMWLLASAAQKVPIGYGRPFNGTVIDGTPIVIQEHYYWVSLKPTIRSNWPPDD